MQEAGGNPAEDQITARPLHVIFSIEMSS